MAQFVSFVSDFLEVIVDFLMAEPIFWFVCIFLLITVIGLLRRLVHL